MKGIQINTILGALALLFISCESHSGSGLKNALTFYASFDNGTTADFALGDDNIYTANAKYVDSKRVLEQVQSGMHNTDHKIVKEKGKFGDAFEFTKTDNKVIFYKSKDNIAYDVQSWSGTISFWLSVNPSTDLDGYTDPIQITDASYNDASIWVDFTDATPPAFRLGVIGDKNVWTKDTLNSSVKEVFDRRITSVQTPPFTRSTWTHVSITYSALGTANSVANLYLDGEKVGTVSGVDDPFTWKLEESNIFLGLGFNGLMDELSIFNKPFTDEEVKELYNLKEGIKSIL